MRRKSGEEEELRKEKAMKGGVVVEGRFTAVKRHALRLVPRRST